MLSTIEIEKYFEPRCDTYLTALGDVKYITNRIGLQTATIFI